MSNLILTNTAISIASTIKSTAFYRAYRARLSRHERSYYKVLVKYLKEQERLILRSLKGGKGMFYKAIDPIEAIMALIESEGERLIDMSAKPITLAIGTGSDLASAQINGTALLEGEMDDLFFARQPKLRGITANLFKELKSNINTGLSEGETISEIADRVRSIYDVNEWRATRIARTEVSSAMGKGSLTTYENNGIEKKIWIDTADDLTRDTHAQNAADGPIPIDGVFSGTGEQHPGESEINCRCAIAAHIE